MEQNKDPRIDDFIATYSRPKPPKPYFGFFRVGEKGINGTGKYYVNKLKRLNPEQNLTEELKATRGTYYKRKDPSRMYIIVGDLFNEGYTIGEIALNLKKTKPQITSLLRYYKTFYD